MTSPSQSQIQPRLRNGTLRLSSTSTTVCCIRCTPSPTWCAVCSVIPLSFLSLCKSSHNCMGSRTFTQVLPLISGILIDSFGIPKMVMVLITAASTGQLLFTGGAYFRVSSVVCVDVWDVSGVLLASAACLTNDGARSSTSCCLARFAWHDGHLLPVFSINMMACLKLFGLVIRLSCRLSQFPVNCLRSNCCFPRCRHRGASPVSDV